MAARSIAYLVPAVDTQDGAGVRLRRALGAQPGARLDPLLMLDAFSSDNPGDYIAGFPAHPHRGFETVTYILDGHMLHEDHLGNRGDLTAGGVQPKIRKLAGSWCIRSTCAGRYRLLNC
jgi:redox-sensitive bicupin YhaK (pirin superfamily)